MALERLVYHDEHYPTSWVSKEISDCTSKYFSQKGFNEVNADELAKTLQEMIRTGTAGNTIVVFAQDIIPATVAHGPSPDTIIKRYLDAGGRVLWIGDTPFYYQGHFDEKKVEWGVMGEREILDVITRFMWPLHIDITSAGTEWGLKLKWTGYRPVDPLYSNLSQVLAHSLAGAYAHAWLKNFNRDYPYSGFVRLWDYALHDISEHMFKELYSVSIYLLE